MAYIGKQPYDLRLTQMEHQPEYHALDICGSSFHGLATTVEHQLKNREFIKAEDQVNKCIKARQNEMLKRKNPDPAHNNAIQILRSFLYKIHNLMLQPKEWVNLPYTLVRYNDRTGFKITINDKVFGGKKRIHKTKSKKNNSMGKRKTIKRKHKN